MFGIEDSLVSTTGLIAGMGVGTHDKKIAVLGGIIAIVIEAVSMGAGEYLSDDAIQELDKLKRHRDKPLASGFIMFASYLLAGLVPLLPVMIFQYPESLIISVALALSTLLFLGYLKGRILKTPAWRGAVKILVVGGLATAIGVCVGLVFRI
jgi:VIT1/CCC1 family predicted Fe2+/Mn2+ transporter